MSIVPIWQWMDNVPFSPVTMYVHIYIIFWFRSTNLLSTKSICQSHIFSRGREIKSYGKCSFECENIRPIKKKKHGNYGTLQFSTLNKNIKFKNEFNLELSVNIHTGKTDDKWKKYPISVQCKNRSPFFPLCLRKQKLKYALEYDVYKLDFTYNG